MWFSGKKQSSRIKSTSEYLNTFPLVPDEQNLLWSQVDFQITCHMDKLKLEKNFSIYLQVDGHLGKLNLELLSLCKFLLSFYTEAALPKNVWSDTQIWLRDF